VYMRRALDIKADLNTLRDAGAGESMTSDKGPD
jgi:hypothetical protein